MLPPIPVPTAPALEQKLDERLAVSGRYITYLSGRRALITFGTATYGPTTVSAQQILLDLESGEGEATGAVVLSDPEGTVTAEKLSFSWIDHTGRAERVRFELGLHIAVAASSIDVQPHRWKLKDVSATNFAGDPPLYVLESPSVTIVPGRSALVKKPRFKLFGNTVLSSPWDARFTLDPREQGIPLPTISVREDGDFGFRWKGSRMIGAQDALSFRAKVYENRAPYYGIQLSRSTVGRAMTPIVPQSEFDTPFSYGYFDFVGVDSPEAEATSLGALRNTYSIGTEWNRRASARRGDQLFDKPVELVWEVGDTRFGVPMRGSLRAQRVVGETHDVNRLLTSGALLAPSYEPLPGVRTHLRGDWFGTARDGGRYGWANLQAGATYQPWKELRLGGAYLLTEEFGTPDFLEDRPFTNRAWHVRGDLTLPSTSLSVLFKYDADRRRWFDTEYRIAQVIGSIVASVTVRGFPDSLQLGLELRLDELLRRLEGRGLTPAERTRS